jgi:Ser/Thr protein kinase RdoA (MazF antagonist)
MRRGGRLPSSLVDLIARDYGLHVGASAALDGGDEAIAWRAEAEPAVLIHQSPTWRTADELSWVHELLVRLTPVFPAVAPLPTRSGRTFVWHGSALITLYPWVEGTHVNRHDRTQREASAAMLARLHRVLLATSMPARPSPSPDAPWMARAPTEPIELVDPQLDRWHADLEDRPEFIRGLVHGDYYRRNLLWSGGRIAAVVDWHEARHGLLIAEVAGAAWEFGKDDSSKTLDAALSQAFLDRYRSAGGPAEVGNAELIVPLIRWRLREEARLSLALAGRGLPDVHRPYREAITAAFTGLRGRSL